MAYEHVTCAADGPFLVVTLNRPDKLNAYTALMGRELADAFRRADEDDAVRAVIVTGAGRGFCAGADISAGAGSFDGTGGGTAMFDPAGSGRAEGFVQRIYACRKPSIAAINGPAVGVGITLALPMDFRIASEDAQFGFIFSRRGLAPEAGSAWFLPRIVGMTQALRWCYSGRIFDAAEALAGGLVSEVAPAGDLLDRARALAAEITAASSPVSVALTRQLLWRFANAPDPFGLLAVDGPIAIERGTSPDVREGVSAFLEKRQAAFPGKVSTDMPDLYPWWSE